MYCLHKMNLPWISTISDKIISQVQITIDNEINNFISLFNIFITKCDLSNMLMSSLLLRELKNACQMHNNSSMVSRIMF